VKKSPRGLLSQAIWSPWTNQKLTHHIPKI